MDSKTHTMVAVFVEDHRAFKDIAKQRKMNMVDLFHEWVVAYPTWPVVKAE